MTLLFCDNDCNMQMKILLNNLAIISKFIDALQASKLVSVQFLYNKFHDALQSKIQVQHRILIIKCSAYRNSKYLLPKLN